MTSTTPSVRAIALTALSDLRALASLGKPPVGAVPTPAGGRSGSVLTREIVSVDDPVDGADQGQQHQRQHAHALQFCARLRPPV